MLENTTHIGDIRIRQIPSGYKVKETFVACVDCGIGRWVRVGREQKEQQRCKVCGAKHGFSPEHKAAILAGSKRRWAKPGSKEHMKERMSGVNNPFFGKRHTPEIQALIAKKRELDIDVKPTKEWGYFIGIVLGDGWIAKTSGGNYKVGVSSSRPEIVDIFYDCVTSLGLHCTYEVAKVSDKYKLTAFNKNADMQYRAVLLSKRVYNYVRPLKTHDFHFSIPEEVYTNIEMMKGFLSGYFDAEGSIYSGSSVNGWTIACYSKHESNLMQIQKALKIFGINSYIQVRTDRFASQLIIANYEDRDKFRQLISFRIQRKQDKLNNMKKPTKIKNSKEIREYVESLLKQNIPSVEIKEKTGLTFHTISYWKGMMLHPEKRYCGH